MIITRRLISIILQSLATSSVTVVYGPRQTGKTTLARCVGAEWEKQGRAVHLDMEYYGDREKLREPQLYFQIHKNSLFILDEFQGDTEILSAIRRQIDFGSSSERFLLFVSSQGKVRQNIIESLAGRVVIHEFSGYSLKEVGDEYRDQLWLRGGFPQSFGAVNDNESYLWREQFIRAYLERIIPTIGKRVPASTFRRFLSMLACNNGQIWNGSMIGHGLGTTSPAAKRYLDTLCELMIVRQLYPYLAQVNKRLVKTPKVYVRDSGLLHALLGVIDINQLSGHPVIASSWEGFVIEQILGCLPDDMESYFYRTAARAEIDLVILPKNGIPIPFDIVRSLTPKATIGFKTAMEELGCSKGYVVYPGTDIYPLTPTITAFPASLIHRISV